MPASIGICGFEGGSTSMDRITVASGTPAYDTSNVPAGGSGRSLGGNTVQLRIPWYDDENAGRYSATDLWVHLQLYTGVNNTNNDFLRAGVGSNGSEFITVSSEDNTNRLTIRVAGTVRATAATEALSLSTWKRLHIRITGVTSGETVEVYTDGALGTPVVSYTLTGTDQTNLAAVGTGAANEFYIHSKSGDSTSRFDNLLAYDASDAGMPDINRLTEPSIEPRFPTGNGAQADWSGSYTDIDEVPPNDADKITSTAVGDESTFTHAAIARDNVFAVKQMARITRIGTDAGANISFRAHVGSDVAGSIVDAPGDGYRHVIWQVQPAALGDWSPVAFDGAEFGYLTVT